MPKIEEINKMIDSLIMLNRIEENLTQLKELEIVKSHQPLISNTQDQANRPIELSLTQMISSTIDCVRQGMRMALTGQQDKNILYQQLLNFLEEIKSTLRVHRNKTKTYTYRFSNYIYRTSAYSSLFGEYKPEKNPITELANIVTDLNDLVSEIKLIERMQEISRKAISANTL
jgi:hypothetical protein